MSSQKTLKPWLNQVGKTLSDKELKRISKNWSQEDWDLYLYESGTEKPLSSYESTYSTFSELLKQNEYKPSDETSEDFNLNTHTNKLGKDSRILLHLIYWEDQPLVEVSSAINKTYFKTKKLKTQTLEKLKISLQKDSQIMETYYETN